MVQVARAGLVHVPVRSALPAKAATGPLAGVVTTGTTSVRVEAEAMETDIVLSAIAPLGRDSVVLSGEHPRKSGMLTLY